jgi:hypothetical protein
MNFWMRQVHRWMSVAFTVAVVGVFIAMAVGHGKQPPGWIIYSPLPPLFLLLFTGLYLFVLPYLRRKARNAD